MSVRKLLEDLDVETMDDEVVIDDNMDVVDDVATRLFVTDDEGNLISAHIYANEILLTYELTEEELMNLLKESGEAFKFFTFTLEGVDELVIGNELCTIEDIKNQFLSSLEDGEELEFDVVEIKDEKEKEETSNEESQLPTEEQLKEGWGEGKDFIYYCVSDGMNPRNSVIIPDGEGARERAIEIGKNNPNFKYVSMFKNGDEIVIWHSDDFGVKGMRVEESVKEGPDNIFGYINGDLESFDPKAFIEKVKERKTSLHTNRMIKDTDDVKVCHHIVCEILGLGDEPKIWVDVVEETWTRNSGYDADDVRSYEGTETQDRILMEKCGKGEEGFAKAIEVLEKYKKDTLAKNESLKEAKNDKWEVYWNYDYLPKDAPELFLVIYNDKTNRNKFKVKISLEDAKKLGLDDDGDYGYGDFTSIKDLEDIVGHKLKFEKVKEELEETAHRKNGIYKIVFPKASANGGDLEYIYHGWEECSNVIKDLKKKKEGRPFKVMQKCKDGWCDVEESLKEEKLSESKLEKTTFEDTFKATDKKYARYISELEDALGAEELYGGSILEIKNIICHMTYNIYDDGVDAEFEFQFDALVDGDFDEDEMKPHWIRFKLFNDGPAFNGYYTEYGPEVESKDEVMMDVSCYKGNQAIIELLQEAGYEPTYNGVETILLDNVDDPYDTDESLQESGSHEENISKIKTYSGLNKYLEKHPELFLKSTGKGSLGVFKEVDGLEEFVCEVDRFYRPFHKEVKKADLKIVKEEQEDPREKFKKDNLGYKFYELYCEPNEEIKYSNDNFSIIIRMPIEEPKPTQEEAELFLGDKLNVDGKQYHVVGIWEDEGGSVFDPFENAEYIIDYAKPQTISASATKEEVKNEGAEGKRVPGKEFVIYDASEEGKAPIVAIRKTYVEAQYYCTRHFGDDLGIEEVPVGRFKVGDDFYGPFDQDWNLIED